LRIKEQATCLTPLYEHDDDDDDDDDDINSFTTYFTASGIPRNFFSGGSTNSVEDRGQ
jgi:hypothetical protein